MTITGNDVVASLQLCMQVVSRDSKALAGVQAETRHGEQQMEADGQYKSGAAGINPAQQSQVSDPLPVGSVLPPHCVRTLPSFLPPYSAAGLFLGSGSSESRLTRLNTCPSASRSNSTETETRYWTMCLCSNSYHQQVETVKLDIMS